MIVKKVPARPAGRNATIERAAHARRLVDYLRSPEKNSAEKAYMVDYMLREKLGKTADERLFHTGARGFISTTPGGQRAEMMAIAQMAKRSPNPVDHWILSWPEGELPEPDQIDKVVALFVEHLGVADQPCIYAVHGDTHNRHLHIALNRYDPVERRMVEINAGFNLEAAHQAVAIIVDRFGWRPETDARYEVVGDRVVLTASAQARIEEGREPIGQQAVAYENRTGYCSAQRIAQEEAVPIIVAARSWRELHTKLAEAGMSYTLTGTNGALIKVGDERVKASRVHRAITRTRLEKQLGAFEAPEATLAPAARVPERNRFLEAFRADEYRAEREHWQKKKQTAEASDPELETPSTMVAIARAAARAREGGVSKRPNLPKKPPPNLESWYYRQGEGLFADRWRNRGRRALFSALLGNARPDVEAPVSIDGYYGYRCAEGTRYARGPRAATEFIDCGSRVDVVVDSDRALLAGLRLAALKLEGRVIIRAEPAIRDRIVALAEANGLSHLLHATEQQVPLDTKGAAPVGSVQSNKVPNSGAGQDIDGVIHAAADLGRVPPANLPATSGAPSLEAPTPPPSQEMKPASKSIEAAHAEDAVDQPSFAGEQDGQSERAAEKLKRLARNEFLKRAEEAATEASTTKAADRVVHTELTPLPSTATSSQQRVADHLLGSRRQTRPSSPTARSAPVESLGKGPDDRDPPPPGWPPSRGRDR